MKKGMILLTMLLFVSGCGKRKLPEKIEWLDGHRRTDREMADACMEQIVNAINNDDKDALLELISDNAKEERGESEYKEGIENLFSYIDGEIEEYTSYVGPSTASSSMMGIKTLELRGYYELFTSEGDYWLCFHFCPRNDKDEGEMGITRIVATTSQIEQQEGFYWKYAFDSPGIYFISEEDFPPDEEDMDEEQNKAEAESDSKD